MLSLMRPSPPPLQPPLVTRRRDTQPMPRLSWGLDAGEYVLAGCGDATPADSGSDAELGEEHTDRAIAKGKEFVVFTELSRKLGEVYESMESSKRQYMVEVKRMRRDFQRDLDARWWEIVEKAEVEIASLGEEDGEEDDEEEGDDNRRLVDDDGGKEQNNGTVDASPQRRAAKFSK